MKFDTTFLPAAVPVTVLSTHGDIDASNYRELIQVVQSLYRNGTRDLLLDLGDTGYMSSSGLVALHSITLLLSGAQPLDVEDGWSALHEMGQGLGGPQAHIKLLNARPRVDRTLEIAGLKPFYELFSDQAAALEAFQKKTA